MSLLHIKVLALFNLSLLLRYKQWELNHYNDAYLLESFVVFEDFLCVTVNERVLLKYRVFVIL